MAGGGQQGGQPGSPDNAFKPFWMILIAFLLGYIIWFEAHDFIVKVIFHLKYGEMKAITAFFPIQQLETWEGFVQQVPDDSVTWDSVKAVCGVVGLYIRYPFCVILVGLGFWTYLRNTVLKYRQAYSMKTLRAQEQVNWPQILPVLTKDLAREDIKIGPWAMALTPMEFARQHNLLKKDEFAPKSSNMDIPLTATIKKGEARRIFTLQLGPYWTGFDALPPHYKALAAIFMAKINRDRDGAVKLLRQLSLSSVKGPLDMTMVAPLINKHKNTELVQEIVQRHAYVMTNMAALLEGARDDGVLASADFLWLKPLDRRLWYVLNSMGRQTPFVEVAGICAHLLVEKKLRQRSLMPMVEEAVKALDIAVKEIKLTQKEWETLP